MPGACHSAEGKLIAEACSEMCAGQERPCAGRFSSQNCSARLAGEMWWEKADSLLGVAG